MDSGGGKWGNSEKWGIPLGKWGDPIRKWGNEWGNEYLYMENDIILNLVYRYDCWLLVEKLLKKLAIEKLNNFC